MRFFRGAWVVLAVVVLGLDAIGIPYAYTYYAGVCDLGAEACFDKGLLTPEAARELEELGLSRSIYAAHDVGLTTFVTLVFFALAAVIYSRRPDDRMALFGSYTLLLAGGAAIAGTMQELPAVHPVFWFPVNLLSYAGQVCFGIFFFLFPDGSFVPRWTRWLAVASALYFIPSEFFPNSSLSDLVDPLFLVFIISLVFAQVYRYRRVATPVQRQQTKWVVSGFATAMVGFAILLVFFSTVWESTGPLGEMIAETLIYGLILLVPFSIGVAILRSHLYDIDVIVNRALVYGPLTALLVLIYFAGVVGSQYVFRALTDQGSTLAVVASTLAIAALFDPLRRRVQAFIDRRFYRRKYDAARTLAVFSSRLREETDLDELSGDLVRVVRETVQPEHVILWLREPEKPA